MCTPVRVLLRHSVVVASPKRIVINHTQLFTVRFGTSVPKSKSGSHISLFVLELSFPNRKAEVIFHYSFWNFRSKIEKRKLICHNLFWNKSKNRALSVLELALQIEERTLKQKLDSQFDTEERPTSLLHKSLSNSNRNREKKFCFQVGYSVS